MIRVKNNGVASVITGGSPQNPTTSEVFEAKIKPFYLGKGKAKFEILFTGKNPNWYETKVISPKVDAVEADPENGIEAVQGKSEVLDVCPENEFVPYGWHPYPEFECGAFEADEEDANLTAICYQQALVVLGSEWEMKP